MVGTPGTEARLRAIFAALAAHYGPRHWWPAETPFEVAVGAILTQNTAWSNVERAIVGLKGAGVLTPAGVAQLPEERLQQLIRPAGFFRQKARRLQVLARHLLAEHGGAMAALLDGELEQVRRHLLGFSGIGPETADSILLYAGARPTFVVDAYTRRLFARLGLLAGDEGYEAIRALFMTRLPADVALYNEYHALIVEHCKVLCRKRQPHCRSCPLRRDCGAAAPAVAVAVAD